MKLGEYHRQNLEAFRNDVHEGVDVVICDNTNLLPWHTEPYTQVAREHGYIVVFIDFSLRSLSEHCKAQEVTELRPDAHNIPEVAIKNMMKDYETYKDLLDSMTPIDFQKHRCYVWCPDKKRNVLSDEVCKHYDLDYLISLQADTLESNIKIVLDNFKKIIFSQNPHLSVLV